ncbi:hypothetical protein SCHPADRAFT_947842 [Schizopora paradoxa]|uniref:Uncharacterized protein n=1 Tax=Schizopora paradoxa TaxID=27342 RepID=A0A0H2QY04_9AGAM|nr:hypothetical protein SCHPADRAFT_947842 [Schizopora paradoxa]
MDTDDRELSMCAVVEGSRNLGSSQEHLNVRASIYAHGCLLDQSLSRTPSTMQHAYPSLSTDACRRGRSIYTVIAETALCQGRQARSTRIVEGFRNIPSTYLGDLEVLAIDEARQELSKYTVNTYLRGFKTCSRAFDMYRQGVRGLFGHSRWTRNVVR